MKWPKKEEVKCTVKIPSAVWMAIQEMRIEGEVRSIQDAALKGLWLLIEKRVSLRQEEGERGKL